MMPRMKSRERRRGVRGAEGALGVAGGTIGFLIGVVLARWIGGRVFGVAISPRMEVFPVTVALTVVVALAGALPLRLLGRVRPAEILRGE